MVVVLEAWTKHGMQMRKLLRILLEFPIRIRDTFRVPKHEPHTMPIGGCSHL